MDIVKLNKYYESRSYHNGVIDDGRALREGFPLPAAKSPGPRVLPAGVTVLLHAGSATMHGHDKDYEYSGYRQEYEYSGMEAYTAISFRFRNSYLQLTGPMQATEVLERLNIHAGIEVRRLGAHGLIIVIYIGGVEREMAAAADGDQPASLPQVQS